MRSLLLDTNLLLLSFVGSVAPDQVGKARGVKEYDNDDYLSLVAITDQFERFLTTPNVLTELSNLIGSTGRRRAVVPELYDALTAYATLADETYLPTQEGVADSDIARLGLTDVCLLRLAETGATIVSDDHALVAAAHDRGIAALNFSYTRTPGFMLGDFV